MKKGIVLNATDYLLPTEICAMVNVVIDAKNQSLKLCAVDGVDVVSVFCIKWNFQTLHCIYQLERLCVYINENWLESNHFEHNNSFFDTCDNILQEKAKQESKEKKVNFQFSLLS